MADQNSRLFFLSDLLIKTLILLLPLIPCHAQTLFVFGDGLYDAGNKQFLAGGPVPANSPPYGMSIGESTGRWSDGLIVPDFIATFMGIPLVPPILEKTANFSHGANFAIADATVLGSPPETMTLSQQVMNFSGNKEKWSDENRSKAIYLFYIGGDDYLGFVKENPNPSEAEREAFVNRVMTAIDAALKAIYGAGGRKFSFQNLAPLGCLPIVKQENGHEKECVKLPSEMAALHNKKLLQLLEKLARDLKSFQFCFFDFFGSIHRRVRVPKTYTFGTGNDACCGSGSHNASACSRKNVCTDPNEYVFFDGKHLTQASNSQIGHLIWAADADVIRPNNLRELLVLPLDIPAIFGIISDAKVKAPIDKRSNIHNVYEIRSLEWGIENHWSYQVEGATSFYTK
ncbi:PREDICTED: inactive GDSL esterase/lipase-like protein 25 [Tarenaya hassleriana]|uniref:inactive GDSL esterase/lipase-like protein 25 n=1 Tax=Tarenaya hassleriana TaxID=28532 RepID=UPI00053C78EA|nr:PREDICTED: inactive GDSL esterase/lipase-like protein 25 [Tarenaya hassleriana]